MAVARDAASGYASVAVDDEIFDEAATRRVANRALVSAGLAFLAGIGGALTPLSNLVVLPLLVVAIIVAVSAIRTLNHPEARVIGGVRHVGIVIAAFGALAAGIVFALRLYVVLRT